MRTIMKRTRDARIVVNADLEMKGKPVSASASEMAEVVLPAQTNALGKLLGGHPPRQQLHGYRFGGLHRFPESRESRRNRHVEVARQPSIPHLTRSWRRGLFRGHSHRRTQADHHGLCDVRGH